MRHPPRRWCHGGHTHESRLASLAPALDRYRRNIGYRRASDAVPPKDLPGSAAHTVTRTSPGRGKAFLVRCLLAFQPRARVRRHPPSRRRAEGPLSAPPLRVHRRRVVSPPLPGAGPDALAERRGRDCDRAREQRRLLLRACAAHALVVPRSARAGRRHALGLLGAALDGGGRPGGLPPLLVRLLPRDAGREPPRDAARERVPVRRQLHLRAARGHVDICSPASRRLPLRRHPLLRARPRPAPARAGARRSRLRVGPGARGEGRGAHRGAAATLRRVPRREPRQVRVHRQHVARAAHAAPHHDGLHGDAARRRPRANERGARSDGGPHPEGVAHPPPARR